MTHARLANDPCPVARALDAVGDWWSLLIVRDAFAGKRRFGEFLASLGVARNILADRLRKLVACGVLEPGPAARDYVLTARGRGLVIVLAALMQWGEDDGAALPDWALIDRKSGRRVHLELRTERGRRIDPARAALAPAAGVVPN